MLDLFAIVVYFNVRVYSVFNYNFVPLLSLSRNGVKGIIRDN